MTRFAGLIVACGILLASASAANAQVGIQIGNPYRGGLTIGTGGYGVPYGGYGTPYGGYVGNPYGGYAANSYGYAPATTVYSSGYAGYAPTTYYSQTTTYGMPGFTNYGYRTGGFGYPGYGYSGYGYRANRIGIPGLGGFRIR